MRYVPQTLLIYGKCIEIRSLLTVTKHEKHRFQEMDVCGPIVYVAIDLNRRLQSKAISRIIFVLAIYSLDCLILSGFTRIAKSRTLQRMR